MELLVERWNSEILKGRPVVKATTYNSTDTNMRKLGERMRLDTSVVHAVNDECSIWSFE